MTIEAQWVTFLGEPAYAVQGVFSAMQSLHRGTDTHHARQYFYDHGLVLNARECGILDARGADYVRQSDVEKMIEDLEVPITLDELLEVMFRPEVWGAE